ncbi:hypothetical protein ES288_A06G054700v1 [Gossypium darwinii]|uniref:Uncharacterized protein n=2 Tax=Gossypium TaxID=3633 RepID=A0A5D2Q098_GOSTO|nr:hypothetical protein ES288_A06G054700v1 [Gossypium darwinii]TYI21669.1 hypothetical protein ES332_A06G053600v1 [Gossypium tomentosum]
MLCPSSLTMTVNSISLNNIFFNRSKKVIARTPSIVVVFTSPSSNSRSLSLPTVGTVRSRPDSPVNPSKNLSFHDKDCFGSGSPPIVMSSTTKLSLKLTFLVF